MVAGNVGTGSPGLVFRYEADGVMDGRGWGFYLGPWRVGSKTSPEDLKPLQHVHTALALEIPTWETVEKLAKAYLDMGKAVAISR